MIVKLKGESIDEKFVIERFNPKPGDIFTITIEERFHDDRMFEKLAGVLKEAAGGEIKLVILEGDVELNEMDDKTLDELGLCRKKDS